MTTETKKATWKKELICCSMLLTALTGMVLMAPIYALSFVSGLIKTGCDKATTYAQNKFVATFDYIMGVE